MRRRRTVISFETLARSFYQLPDSAPSRARCDECGEEVSWLTPYQVVALTGLTLREIFRGVEAAEIHYQETIGGLLHICPKSIAGKPEG